MTSDPKLEEKDPYLVQARRIAALQNIDPASAFKALQDLAPRSVNGLLLLGWACEMGLGTAVDPVQAQAWYRLAADKGSAIACFYLGNLHLKQKAYPEARDAFAAGATLDQVPSRDALNRLDEWQRREDEYAPLRRAYDLLKTDPVRAQDTLHELAEQGSTRAMFYLGCVYERGEGAAVDPDQAVAWYRRAYERDPGQTKKQAAYYLGCLYQNRQDYANARDLFLAGVDLDYAPAIYRLGLMYRDGLGVAKQPDQARSLFERASALGNLHARRSLAIQYISGRFGPIHIFKGLHLLLSTTRDFYTAVTKDPSSECLFR